MSKKHYKIRKDLSIEFEDRTLYRIEALKDLPKHNVKKGDIGGFVESYDNLADAAWVGGDAKVYDNAKVTGDAWVYDNARVFDNAEVSWHALVRGNAKVFGNAQVCDYAQVFGNAQVCGHSWVYEDATVCDNARVFDNAAVCGTARVFGNARVFGYARVACGDIKKLGDVRNITGERYNITILPNHIKIGCQLYTKEEWFNFEDHEILEMDGKEGLKWWKKWKPLLQGMSE